jgi:hypothetical protein
METSAAVSAAIFDTGREFLPIGGFTGRVPNPTVTQFVGYVRRGTVRTVLVSLAPRTRNPDMLWTIAHCPKLPDGVPDTYRTAGRPFAFYVCVPADATRAGL